jgi:hypothetical protein
MSAFNSDAVVPRTTSVPTAVVLAIFAATYVTMGFLLSAVVAGLTALVWAGIAWRKD